MTGPNTPVIDAAVVGRPEVHSVKTVTPGAATERAVRSADAESPRDLAVRIAGHVDTALVDRRSAKWALLQRRWNTTMRDSHEAVYGYPLPRNPDEIPFVVEVRVVTPQPPSPAAQQRVQAEAASWLSKNQRIPPKFTWRITYVTGQ
jgi:hypothetical protein